MLNLKKKVNGKNKMFVKLKENLDPGFSRKLAI